MPVFPAAEQGTDGAHARAALRAAAAGGEDGSRAVRGVMADGAAKIGFRQGVADTDIHETDHSA